jgi:hypothetical protein
MKERRRKGAKEEGQHHAALTTALLATVFGVLSGKWMNLVKMALLWLLAAAVAIWAYLRLRRGKVTLLEGRFSPAFIRMVAIVLVYFNGGCPEPKLPNAAMGSPSSASTTLPRTKPASAPTNKFIAAPKDFPAVFDSLAMYELQYNDTWRETTQKIDAFDTEDTEARFNEAISYVSYVDDKDLADLLKKKLERQREAKADTPEQLSEFLDLIAKNSLYHPWLIGYVWRSVLHTAGESATPLGSDDGTLATLLSRLEYHQRILHSLMLAEAEVGPVTFVPWRSKAAPPSGYGSLKLPLALVETAKKKFPTTDAGTWESEAVLEFAVKSAPTDAVFFAGGEQRGIGKNLRLVRFSMLVVPGSSASPVVLTHPKLGDLTIAPGQALTAWNVRNFLSTKTLAELQSMVAKALAGDETIIGELEAILPAVEDLLREALRKEPTAKGAPALRTLIALFDE